MATKAIDLGAVSAYAVAVKNGFVGTEAEWEQYIANASINASQAASASEAAAAAQAAAEASEARIAPAVAAGIQAVEDQQGTSVAAVQAEGATQVQAVRDAGAEQDAGLVAEGQNQIQAIQLAAETQEAESVAAVQAQETESVAAVNQAGTTQTAAVNQAGATQVSAVETKGAETIASIPEDYTELTNEVDDLKSALNVDEAALKVTIETENVPVTMNKYMGIGITNKTINEYGGGFYLSSPITVSEGDVYVITCEGYGTTAAYAFGNDGVISYVFPEAVIGTGHVNLVEDKRILIPVGVNELYISNTTQGTVIPYGVAKVIKQESVLYKEQTKTDVEKQTARNNIGALGLDEFFTFVSDVASRNKVPFDVELTSKKIIKSSGIIADYDNKNYKVSNYIDISNVSDVYVTGSNNFANGICAFYDANQNFVSMPLISAAGSTNTHYTDEHISVPSNVAYMVIASNNTVTVASAFYYDGYIPKKKWEGKKWCVVGDSLTEHNSRTDMNYHDFVAEETGITVVNMGVSGTGYKRKEDTNKAFYQRILNVPTDCDVVTIFGSGNDQPYYGAELLGTATDTGTDTIGGCVNTTIDNLYSVIPAVHLAIVAPCPWKNYNPVNHDNGMARYTQLLKEICENRSIPFLDLYHCSNLRPWDASFRELAYSKDTDDGGITFNGVHPNEIGHKLIAGRFESLVEAIL